MPPKVSDAMDDGQKWAVACTRTALARCRLAAAPAGSRPHRRDPGQRASAGSNTTRPRCASRSPSSRASWSRAGSFAALPAEVRARDRERAARASFMPASPSITEDTMPGELANCIAGRVANLFNLRGPNFTVDAACASAMAAIDAAVDGLQAQRLRRRHHRRRRPQHGRRHVRQVLQDRRAVGHRHAPVRRRRRRLRHGRGRRRFRAQAPGRRRARRRPHLRGRPRHRRLQRRQGQGHHRAQPVGQRLAVERAWDNAGLSPGAVHARRGSRHVDPRRRRRRGREPDRGLRRRGAAPGSIALGSVKSNIGHLKAAAGAAGHAQDGARAARQGAAAEPNFDRPNPNIDLAATPFAVNTELREWPAPRDGVRARRASAPSASAAPTSTSCWRSTCRAVPRHEASALVAARRPRPAITWTRPRTAARAEGAAARAPRSRAGATRPTSPRSSTGCGAARGPATRRRRPRRTAAAGRAPERLAIDYARRRRTWRPRPSGAHRRCAAGNPAAVAGAARAGYLPRQRRRGQGRVPVHRPGLAVRQHAAPTCARASRRRRDVRRGRPRHDAAARAGR